MPASPPPDPPRHGRPSAVAVTRLHRGLRGELDRARLRFSAALLQGDAALRDGDGAAGARAIEEQRHALRALCVELDRLIADAAVERAAEQVVDHAAEQVVDHAAGQVVDGAPAGPDRVAAPARTRTRLTGTLAALAVAVAFVVLGGGLPVSVPDVLPLAGATTTAGSAAPVPVVEPTTLRALRSTELRDPTADGWLEGLGPPPSPTPWLPPTPAPPGPAASVPGTPAPPSGADDTDADDGADPTGSRPPPLVGLPVPELLGPTAHDLLPGGLAERGDGAVLPALPDGNQLEGTDLELVEPRSTGGLLD